MEILNDIRKWLLDETIITDIVGTKIWKYECRLINDKVFGVSGSRALVLNVLPGFDNNPMSSQQNGILEVKFYASNTISVGKKTKDDAEDRCWAFYYIGDKILNRCSRETKQLTDFLILGIFRTGQPFLQWDDEQECPFLLVNYEFIYILS